MKPLRRLVTTVHGSHLYGTSTPESDRDYKGVHLPSGQGILLQRPENVFDESIKAKDAAGKNTGDAIDHQSYSVEKFCRMLAIGDGFATEILFAPDDCIVEAAPEWDALKEEAKALLNREVKGFVGYCKQQAAKYGVKGSRMEAVEKLVILLNDAMKKHDPKTRLEVIEDELRAFTDQVEMANLMVIESGCTKDMLHIECCGRKVSMRSGLEDASKIYGAVWNNYGERARRAKESKGVDWKAVSHAVRVARQAQELMTTGRITFPRPDAEELLDIKLGKFAYTDIQPMLEGLIDELDRIDSVLPPKPDEDEIERIISEIVLPRHLSQITV